MVVPNSRKLLGPPGLFLAHTLFPGPVSVTLSRALVYSQANKHQKEDGAAGGGGFRVEGKSSPWTE